MQDQKQAHEVGQGLTECSDCGFVRIAAMEKFEPQSPVYPLMTTAKYKHALDILYKDQERELKIQTTKVKEAEAEVRPLRTELLMLNSHLSTM
jgi:hypothetical protein